MTGNSEVRARIDERTKKEAAAVLAAMGLTLSDAFRLLVKRIAAEKALPFERLVPNEKTIAAMREARAGRLPRFKSAKDSAAGIECPSDEMSNARKARK
jgi:DNA-damage-inducible protein J